MAGNYPDVPSWRMAWDRDGTQAYYISSSGVITQMAAGDMQKMNSEGGIEQVGLGGQAYILFWFPEKRDLDGYWAAAPNVAFPTVFNVETSTDTTNGLDGTWTTLRTGYAPDTSVSPIYRSAIQSTSVLGIRAIRFKQTASTGNAWYPCRFHFYGEIIPGANPNRLILWHPTLDQRIAPSHFDWGDTPRSSSADRQFRVKNNSATLTANSIRVAQEILTDAAAGNPSVVGQHTLSTDGTTFLPQVNVGNLAPGALSSVVTLRRNTPSNAQLGVWAHRVFAEANSWS